MMSSESFPHGDSLGYRLGKFIVRSMACVRDAWSVLYTPDVNQGAMYEQREANMFQLKQNKQDAMDIWALNAMQWSGSDIATLIDEAETRPVRDY
jgi:hypothetical protein